MKYFVLFFIISVSLFANVGKIILLKGKATILREKNIIQAKLGDTIFTNDKIDTYKKTKLKIILNDNTTLTFGQNTEYTLDAYNDKKNPKLEMTLLSGLLTTVSGRIGKIAPHKFKLRTKTALIGIRGTHWRTFVGKRYENSVCFKGAITIKTAKKRFEIPSGYMLITKDGVSQKFKMNMKFYNSLLKRAQAKQKLKVVSTQVSQTKDPRIETNTIQVQNANLNTNVKINNVNVSSKASATIGTIKLD
ncbi:FecR domain-containing protein [Sulfurimonas sp. SAG-AH-194-I05]|nr:FecR family protein [Sulfurimonas sp. SAG-AH-194-I05]MDF1874278.1 FecR domain-containing protein [Sulfurimonas sp. SAG-AH-194-I05]